MRFIQESPHEVDKATAYLLILLLELTWTLLILDISTHRRSFKRAIHTSPFLYYYKKNAFAQVYF